MCLQIEHTHVVIAQIKKSNTLCSSHVAQLVKNPPAMWETWVPSLSWEDPLEDSMTTHCRILA